MGGPTFQAQRPCRCASCSDRLLGMLFKWKDSGSWRPLVEKTKGRRQTRTTMLDAFRDLYCGVEVYHGCRPGDVSDYYRHGLRLADHQALTQTARGVFLSG